MAEQTISRYKREREEERKRGEMKGGLQAGDCRQGSSHQYWGRDLENQRVLIRC